MSLVAPTGTARFSGSNFRVRAVVSAAHEHGVLGIVADTIRVQVRREDAIRSAECRWDDARGVLRVDAVVIGDDAEEVGSLLHESLRRAAVEAGWRSPQIVLAPPVPVAAPRDRD
jgi:hypothetical protein